MHRRTFVQTGFAASLAAALPAAQDRPPRIILRSSWQTVNIGDVAHSPGVLHLLEQHVPDAEVRLWPGNVGDGVAEMLLRRFPKLIILKGPEAVAQALAEGDFLLHGSGPSLVGQKDVARWRKETGKPYGVYGITLQSPTDETIELLNGARFVYLRDSVSLGVAREHGVRAPVVDFAPDGAFAFDIRNDAAADAFLKANDLAPGKFLCCIPRLRKTPYWKIRGKEMTDADRQAHERNEALKEHDHAPLRRAIEGIVRGGQRKVLLCPEDQSQMAVGKEMLFDKLPEEARKQVVWRDKFWLPDEALSVYARSAGLFGNEMHSPIMCVGNGIPAIVCRWGEQTSKGVMWRDIGLGEWLFDLDDERDVPRIPEAVLKLAFNYDEARTAAQTARQFVLEKQKATMTVVKADVRKSAN